MSGYSASLSSTEKRFLNVTSLSSNGKVESQEKDNELDEPATAQDQRAAAPGFSA